MEDVRADLSLRESTDESDKYGSQSGSRAKKDSIS